MPRAEAISDVESASDEPKRKISSKSSKKARESLSPETNASDEDKDDGEDDDDEEEYEIETILDSKKGVFPEVGSPYTICLFLGISTTLHRAERDTWSAGRVTALSIMVG
jgi:hypothetical protein